MKKNIRNQKPSTRRPETGEPRRDQRPDGDEQVRRAHRNDEAPATPDGNGELKSRDEEGEDEDEGLERS